MEQKLKIYNLIDIKIKLRRLQKNVQRYKMSNFPIQTHLRQNVKAITLFCE